MTRNLKAFGLALVAVLAFSGIVAQAASAVVEHSFRSSSAKTVLTGKNESYTTGSSKDIFTATANVKVECDSTFEGTVKESPSDHVTLHPKYHNCTSDFGNATVDTDGCNYTFDSDTTTSPHSSADEHAAVSLECESNHLIRVTAGGCTLVFGATHSSVAVNQGLHGMRYHPVTHSSKSSLTATGTIKTIHYTALAGSLCGLVGHPAGTYTNGKYDASVEVTGYEDGTHVSGSTTTGTVWSHGPQVDIFLSTST